MRTALCLSGHFRSYEKTHTSIRKYIIDPLNTDVFIHTWNLIGFQPGMDGNTINIPVTYVMHQINTWFKPIQIIKEKMKVGLGEKYRKYLVDRRDPNGIVNMFFKIHEADKLRQNYEAQHNFKYDLVIRARPDLMFEESIKQQYIDEAIKSKALFLPDCGHYTGLNDQFAFGDSDVMKKYSNCFNYLDTMAPKVPFRPEDLLKHYIMANQIPLKFAKIRYTLHRVDGFILDNMKWSPNLPDLTRW